MPQKRVSVPEPGAHGPADRAPLAPGVRPAQAEPESSAPRAGAVGNLAVGRALASHGVQAKLNVSQPGDPEEEEADRIAVAWVTEPGEPHLAWLDAGLERLPPSGTLLRSPHRGSALNVRPVAGAANLLAVNVFDRAWLHGSLAVVYRGAATHASFYSVA